MDESYEQDHPQPESHPKRPAALGFMMGTAAFVLVFSIFIMSQVLVGLYEVRARTPELSELPYPRLLLDTRAAERIAELSSNGDFVAAVEIGSAGIALVALFLLVFLWKKAELTRSIGFRLPAFKPFLAWCALFVGMYAVLDVISRFLPALESDFMNQVLASITNYPFFILASCLMPALFEELLFRGILLGSLRKVMDNNMAIALTALLFTVIHLQYEWQVLLLALLPLAVFLGYARTNTGSIWTGIFLHFVNNAASVLLPLYLSNPTN